MEHKIAMYVSRVTILINFLLSAGKPAAGLLARSGAMVSDAVHSASDVFSTVIVMIGVRAACNPLGRIATGCTIQDLNRAALVSKSE